MDNFKKRIASGKFKYYLKNSDIEKGYNLMPSEVKDIMMLIEAYNWDMPRCFELFTGKDAKEIKAVYLETTIGE